MKIEIFKNGGEFDFPSEEITIEWLKKVAQEEGYTRGTLNFILNSSGEQYEMNRTYLKHEYYTDVITFDYRVNGERRSNFLNGEIYIDPTTVTLNATVYCVHSNVEMHRVMVHGLLHLCGYDDHSDEEKEEMRRRENYHLDKFINFKELKHSPIDTFEIVEIDKEIIKNKGEGLLIKYGLHLTIHSVALIASTPVGIYQVALIDPKIKVSESVKFIDDMKLALPKAEYEEDNYDDLHKQVVSYINNPYLNDEKFKLHIMGTPFQMDVWRAMLHIVYGATCNYKDIAKAIFRPKATRAVGTAVGRNPVGYLIPCHRVLPVSGNIGGYRYGPKIKSKILENENEISIKKVLDANS